MLALAVMGSRFFGTSLSKCKCFQGMVRAF
jgi:hypothetical protein